MVPLFHYGICILAFVIIGEGIKTTDPTTMCFGAGLLVATALWGTQQ